MCSSIVKVTFVFFLVSLNTHVFAIDTSKEEKTCSEIGFKRKTEAFANCVLELVQRNKSTQPVSNQLNRSTTSQITTNNPDDALCIQYGFRVNTNEFAQCKQQIHNARQQAQFQQQQYEQQKRQYDEQQALIEKERKRQQSQRLFDMSQRLASGQSLTDVGRAGMGLPPLQQPMPPQNQTFVMPNGQSITCTTTGSITNCF
jgi:predicted DNA-binding WGR domain protein